MDMTYSGSILAKCSSILLLFSLIHSPVKCSHLTSNESNLVLSSFISFFPYSLSSAFDYFIERVDPRYHKTLRRATAVQISDAGKQLFQYDSVHSSTVEGGDENGPTATHTFHTSDPKVHMTIGEHIANEVQDEESEMKWGPSNTHAQSTDIESAAGVVNDPITKAVISGPADNGVYSDDMREEKALIREEKTEVKEELKVTIC